MSHSAGLGDLCEDVVLEIFSFLPNGQILECTTLCKRMCELIRSRIPLSILISKYGKQSTRNKTIAEIAELRKIFPVLRKLTLNCTGGWWDKSACPVIQVLLARHGTGLWTPTLEELSVLHVINDAPFRFLNCVSAYKNLKKLKISGIKDKKKSATIASFDGNFEELELENAFIPSPVIFARFRKLHTLVLVACSFQGESFSPEVVEVGNMKNLTVSDAVDKFNDFLWYFGKCYPNLQKWTISESVRPYSTLKLRLLKEFPLLRRLTNFSINVTQGYLGVYEFKPLESDIIIDLLCEKTPSLEVVSVKSLTFPSFHSFMSDGPIELDCKSVVSMDKDEKKKLVGLTTTISDDRYIPECWRDLEGLEMLSVSSGSTNSNILPNILHCCKKLWKLMFKAKERVSFGPFLEKSCGVKLLRVLYLQNLACAMETINEIMKTNPNLERVVFRSIKFHTESSLEIPLGNSAVKRVIITDLNVNGVKIHSPRLRKLSLKRLSALRKLELVDPGCVEMIKICNCSYSPYIFAVDLVDKLVENGLMCVLEHTGQYVTLKEHEYYEKLKELFPDGVQFVLKFKKIVDKKMLCPKSCPHDNLKEESWFHGAPTGATAWGRKWICLDCNTQCKSVQDGYSS